MTGQSSSPSRKPPMGRAVIDLEHLARYTGGERQLNEEVLRLFDDQVGRMVGELNGLLTSRDNKRWREVTHSIKGAARGVGAFEMGNLAAHAEPVDPANSPAARDVIEKLESEARTIHAFHPDLSGALKPAQLFPEGIGGGSDIMCARRGCCVSAFYI